MPPTELCLYKMASVRNKLFWVGRTAFEMLGKVFYVNLAKP